MFFRELFHLNVNLRTNRRAVNKEFAARTDEQAVLRILGENLAHRRIICDNGDDIVGVRRNLRQFIRRNCAELRGEFLRACACHIVNDAHVEPVIVQVSSDVRAHPPHTDNANVVCTIFHNLPPFRQDSPILTYFQKIVKPIFFLKAMTCSRLASIHFKLPPLSFTVAREPVPRER